ncbi:uncharacterized protein LOC117105013 [Anneissia japonica]|uniref:uncharacterized protein LOC117105013 n=1 Tax=Anneissia japonica TaxID=1529436 RepID=UPI0014257256|nr:uncharacterized protein LOC117105013 [Anneissia japonica]XP_033101886.1 uncharacterized protein LOC117105013 [Anneissia japonica]
MASYVIPIGSDEDAFHEETQHLVLKMLGLVPLEFYEGEFDEGERDSTARLQLSSQSVDSQVSLEHVMSSCSVDSDLEVDHAPAVSMPSRIVSYSATCSAMTMSRVELTKDELKFEAAAKQLDKMAEMFSAKFEDEFKMIEENFYQNGSYSSFSSFMGKIIPAGNPVWYKISMLFGISRYLLKKDKKHSSGISSYTVNYIEDNFADYIIENGGWDSVASVSLKEMKEGELFHEKSPLEGCPSPQNVKNETVTDGKPSSDPETDKGLQTEDAKQDKGAGDSKSAMESSFFDFNPFTVTATAAAAVAVAYAVIKT